MIEPRTTITYGDVNKPFQNSKLDLEKADRFVKRRGVEVIWEKSAFCPCVSENGVADSMCDACYGRGMMYLEPEDTLVLFTNMSGVPNFMEPGMWIFGVSNVTTFSFIKFGRQDRIILKDFETSYIETATKTTNKIFTNFDIIKIEHVFYQDQNGNVVELKEEEDFTASGKEIIFLDNLYNRARISIRYKSRLRYIVVSMLHEARGITDHNNKRIVLPNQYLVQREDMVLSSKIRGIDGLQSYQGF